MANEDFLDVGAIQSGGSSVNEDVLDTGALQTEVIVPAGGALLLKSKLLDGPRQLQGLIA